MPNTVILFNKNFSRNLEFRSSNLTECHSRHALLSGYC